MSRQEQMMQMVQSTQFWADLTPSKKKRVEFLFSWARKEMIDREGVFWLVRVFQRVSIYLSDDVPPSTKWAVRGSELNAKGYSLVECVEDLVFFLGDSKGEGTSQFQTVYESLRRASATNKRIADSLAAISFVDAGGKDIGTRELYQKLNDLGAALSALEKLSDGTVIMSFADGAKWIDIGKHGCEHEGGLMKHCGNQGGNRSGKLWSYREHSEEFGGVIGPKLTFIYFPDEKALGEMKGRSNVKPKPAFHPVIVALLKTGLVERLNGSGYLPGQNFSLNDLSVELLADLYSVNPALVEYQALKGSAEQRLDAKKFERAKKLAAGNDPGVDGPNQDERVESLVAEFLDTAAPAPPPTRPITRPARPGKPGTKPWKLPPNTRPEDLPPPKARNIDFVLGAAPPETAPPPTRPITRPARPGKPGTKPWKLPPNTRPEDLPRPKAMATEAVDSLLEAPMDMGDNPDMVHQDRKRGLARRDHVLGNNPAYPAHAKAPGTKPDNFEELQASEQYQATLQKLNNYFRSVTGNAQARIRGMQDLQTVGGLVMRGLQTMKQIEGRQKPKLQKLAVHLVFQLPKFKKFKAPYDAGEFKIDAQLTEPDMEGVKFSDEVEDSREEMENFKDIDLEVQKRHALNAMIQGGAVGDNYSFHFVQDELNAIDPKLVGLYGLLMASTEIGYFISGDEAIRAGGKESSVGVVRLDMEGEVPVIRARGMTFPILVQEIIKGLFELVSAAGLPGDKRARKYVMDKTDLLDAETWHMLIGRGMWRNFIKQLDTSEDELTMHLYQKVASMPPREFNAAMKTIQAGGADGKALIKRLAAEIQNDSEDGDRGEFEDPPDEPPAPKKPGSRFHDND